MGKTLAKNCGCSNTTNENTENNNFVELNTNNSITDIPNYFTIVEPPKDIHEIEAYNHHNNFFSIINRIIFLQNYVKKFLKRKKEKKITNQKKGKGKKIPLYRLPVHKGEEKPQIKIKNKVKKKTHFRNKSHESFVGFYSNSIKSIKEYENEKLDVCINLNNPNKYLGEIRNQVKEGLGVVEWEDGSKFKGLFKDSKAGGLGKYIDPRGTIFLGKYENNQPNGWGIYHYHKGSVFHGYWNGTKQNGIGYEVWPDGTEFQGLYLDSRKHGIGIYKWPDGTVYEGEWDRNSIMGCGTIFFNDDRLYTGELKNGKMDGYGEFFWPDGKKYFGYYKDDQKTGFGIFLWNPIPLKIFIGSWVNGKQNGIGIIIQGNKTKYGLWSEGKVKCFFDGLWEMKKYAKSKKLPCYKILEKEIAEILALFL